MNDEGRIANHLANRETAIWESEENHGENFIAGHLKQHQWKELF